MRKPRFNSMIGAAVILALCVSTNLVSCSSPTTHVKTVTRVVPQPAVQVVTAPTSAPADTNNQPVAPPATAVQNDYRIQPLDTVQISVFNEPDLSVSRRVSPQGYITYPL